MNYLDENRAKLKYLELSLFPFNVMGTGCGIVVLWYVGFSDYNTTLDNSTLGEVSLGCGNDTATDDNKNETYRCELCDEVSGSMSLEERAIKVKFEELGRIEKIFQEQNA